jgi:hypothetical protein
MKDLRGAHAAAVRHGILKEFGLQIASNKQKNVTNDISAWKKSPKVKECFDKLYDENDNAIESIAKHAFPQKSHTDKSFDSIYAYTAAICDIVLNPDYPDIECTKKPLQRRFLKFKVFFFLFWLI